MNINQIADQIVYTNKARCRDCYRCVRVCPVKAIRMHNGQAYVVSDRCIACGTCIRECPQEAKSFRNDISKAVSLLSGGGITAVSLAPSFSSAYTSWERFRIPSALRKLGFIYIAETAVGAYYSAQATAAAWDENPNRTMIGSACPAIVRYIQSYRPDLASLLAPVCSPMLVHARLIKEKLGEKTRIVFIGPCVAKKAEAEDHSNQGLVDCVLTFKELNEWLDIKGIRLESCEESQFDDYPAGYARYYPLVGGLAKTAAMHTDLLADNIIGISGFEDIAQAFDDVVESDRPVFIEPLFCSQGCINGPAMPRHPEPFLRRREILEYASQPPVAPREKLPSHRFHKLYSAVPLPDQIPFSEEDIRGVLEEIGQQKPEDQLNCGSCGYASCRERAIAVLNKMAEPEMCIPFMRRQAEKRTDRIIETSPNGIVILDEQLHIISMNPAFRKYFMCSEAIAGKPISYLIDPDPFERLLSREESMVEMTMRYDQYHLICHQIMYPLQEEKQYVGIFMNITNLTVNQEKLDQLRTQTITKARELLEHQIQMAQKLASFLGEQTAKGEELVDNLVQLADEKKNPSVDRKNDGIWDIYTSKS